GDVPLEPRSREIARADGRPPPRSAQESEMNRNAGPVGEDDLHAYVDDQLDPDRRREVDTYLDANPEVRRRIESLRADVAALREEAHERLSSPIPVRLRMTEVRRVRNATYSDLLRQTAAGIVFLAAGVALGS